VKGFELAKKIRSLLEAVKRKKKGGRRRSGKKEFRTKLRGGSVIQKDGSEGKEPLKWQETEGPAEVGGKDQDCPFLLPGKGHERGKRVLPWRKVGGGGQDSDWGKWT